MTKMVEKYEEIAKKNAQKADEANKKNAEKIAEAEKKAAEQKEKEQKLATTLLPIVRSKDLYFVADRNRYMLYHEYGGWKAYQPEAMHKLLGLTADWEKVVFDDVLRADKRMKEATAITYLDTPDNVLNFLSMKEWLEPTPSKQYHPIFDILMDSLSGGKKENRDHIEKCLVYKYLHPEDYRLPCITISGAGGGGKNEFIEKVLATIFTERQVIVLGTDAAFGQFNGQMIGKTVVFIDEAIVERGDAESLKRKVGNKTISINEKYGLQGTFENTPWYWLGGNGTNGAVMLGADVTDRRYSVLTIEHSIMYWVSLFIKHEPLPHFGQVLPDTHPAVQWYRENEKALSDKSEVAKWLYTILVKWKDQKGVPSPLHSDDYKQVIDDQRTPFDEAMEYVFNDPNFKYVEGKVLYQVYTLMCEQSGYAKAFTKKRNKFLSDARNWIKVHAINAKWQKAKIKSEGSQAPTMTTAFVGEGGSVLERNTNYYLVFDDKGEPCDIQERKIIDNEVSFV